MAQVCELLTSVNTPHPPQMSKPPPSLCKGMDPPPPSSLCQVFLFIVDLNCVSVYVDLSVDEYQARFIFTSHAFTLFFFFFFNSVTISLHYITTSVLFLKLKKKRKQQEECVFEICQTNNGV